MRTTTFIFNGHETRFYLQPTAPVWVDSDIVYLQHYSYNIRAQVRELGTENWVLLRKKVGVVEAFRFNCCGADVPSEDPRFASVLQEEAEEVSVTRKVERVFFSDPILSGDLLYLSSIELGKEWRGFGIGLLTAKAVIACHGQSAAVALMPFPLGTWGGRNLCEGLARLRVHWGRLGLSPFQDTDFLWHPNSQEVIKAT